jgi:hypothetical protein
LRCHALDWRANSAAPSLTTFPPEGASSMAMATVKVIAPHPVDCSIVARGRVCSIADSSRNLPHQSLRHQHLRGPTSSISDCVDPHSKAAMRPKSEIDEDAKDYANQPFARTLYNDFFPTRSIRPEVSRSLLLSSRRSHCWMPRDRRRRRRHQLNVASSNSRVFMLGM